MAELRLAKPVVKFLKKRDAKHRERVLELLECLANDAHCPQADVKPLSDTPGCYRLRVGKYRYLYTFIDDVLFLYCYKADSRGDVYK